MLNSTENENKSKSILVIENFLQKKLIKKISLRSSKDARICTVLEFSSNGRQI